jgi:hypothetical protein
VRVFASRGTIVGLPGISLVPCIPDESREDRTQVDSIGVVILEGNGFIAWIIHGVDDEARGSGRSATRGERHGSNTWELKPNSFLLPLYPADPLYAAIVDHRGICFLRECLYCSGVVADVPIPRATSSNIESSHGPL